MSKIMIVEDDPEIGSLLKNIVTSATFDALLFKAAQRKRKQRAKCHALGAENPL